MSGRTKRHDRPDLLELDISFAPLLARCEAYYKLPGNGSGGSLHIVLDDGNTEAGHVGYCAVYASKHDDPVGEELALDLLWLTEAQRDRIYQEMQR